MKKTIVHKWMLAFGILVCINLAGALPGFQILHSLSKPLLIPALMVMLVSVDYKSNRAKIILAGLFFSWLGDLFLLFESRNTLFFIFGLASFLITHLLYIVYFLSIPSFENSLLKKKPLIAVGVLCYGIGLVWLLLPTLGTLKIPVVIYAVVICTMLLFSFHIYLKTTSPANGYFVTGAALFVISDSLLAVNKFYHPFPLAGTGVMFTYCAAQVLIVLGFIESNGAKQPADQHSLV